jgi:hypothetical protein
MALNLLSFAMLQVDRLSLFFFAKVRVAGSNPVFRSKNCRPELGERRSSP